MSTSAVSTPAVSSSSERYTGRVKWFNNKAGYGFITITDGHKSGTDVFVHHSAIKVASEQYKYLVQGEYVNFSLSSTQTEGHEYQAGEICGINGGNLMCETRRESRASRSHHRTSMSEPRESSEQVNMPRPVSVPKDQHSQRSTRTRGQGPRQEGSEWTYVSRTRKNAVPIQSTSQSPIKRRSHPSNASRREE